MRTAKDPVSKVRIFSHANLGLFCLLAPVLWALIVTFLNIPIGHGGFETSKYAKISYDWLDNGLFITANNFPVDQSLNTARLPSYPAFLALIFSIFGRENFTAVLVFQSLVSAATIYFTALSAGEFKHTWAWPAAILSALTLNIAYRGTLALPDTLLTFLISVFVYCALRTMSAQRIGPWLLALGLVGAAALLTRPVFQFALPLAMPAFIAALAVHRKISFRRSVLLALIPAGLMIAAYSGQVLKVRALTGHAVFSTQSGHHLLEALVPCLAQPFGCGEGNPKILAETQKRLAERMPPNIMREDMNPAVLDQIQREIGREMLFELPILPAAISAFASMVKMMLHSPVYEMFDRAGWNSVHFSQIEGSTLSQKIQAFFAAIIGSASMLFWFVSQLAIIGSRLFETAGLLSGLIEKNIRLKILFVTAVAIGLLVPAVGIGNPRYRAPAEPLLIILLMQGLSTALTFGRRFKINSSKR